MRCQTEINFSLNNLVQTEKLKTAFCPNVFYIHCNYKVMRKCSLQFLMNEIEAERSRRTYGTSKLNPFYVL